MTAGEANLVVVPDAGPSTQPDTPVPTGDEVPADLDWGPVERIAPGETGMLETMIFGSDQPVRAGWPRALWGLIFGARPGAEMPARYLFPTVESPTAPRWTVGVHKIEGGWAARCIEFPELVAEAGELQDAYREVVIGVLDWMADQEPPVALLGAEPSAAAYWAERLRAGGDLELPAGVWAIFETVAL